MVSDHLKLITFVFSQCWILLWGGYQIYLCDVFHAKLGKSITLKKTRVAKEYRKKQNKHWLFINNVRLNRIYSIYIDHMAQIINAGSNALFIHLPSTSTSSLPYMLVQFVIKSASSTPCCCKWHILTSLLIKKKSLEFPMGFIQFRTAYQLEKQLYTFFCTGAGGRWIFKDWAYCQCCL